MPWWYFKLCTRSKSKNAYFWGEIREGLKKWAMEGPYDMVL